MFCNSCGKEIEDAAEFCGHCGTTTKAEGGGPAPQTPAGPPSPQGAGQPQAAPPVGGELKSKMAAGLLGILVGGLGIHRFYLGYNTIGIIQLLLCVVGGIFTCGITSIGAGIWGLVEGILILTGSINRDAQGRPLRE